MDLLSSKLAAVQRVADRIDKAWHWVPEQALVREGRVHTLSYRQIHLEDWPAFFGAACARLEALEPQDREFVLFETLNREVFDRFAVNSRIQIEYETRVACGQPRLN